MVAAGATILMAASEENSSNEGTTSPVNQSTYPQCCEIQRCSRRNNESSPKEEMATCSSNVVEKKQRSCTAKKNGMIMSNVESPKESSKNLAIYKTTPIRETRTSRLRAASIVLSNDVTLSSKKLLASDVPGSQRHSPLIKDKNIPSLNSGVAMNPVKERDKSYKRKSYLNRSRHVEAVTVDHSSETDSNERRSRKQSVKRGQISEMVSSLADTCGNRQALGLRRKCTDSKVQDGIAKSPSKNSPFSAASVTSVKCSNLQQPSSIEDSEVSRRVDVLTALTQATMERVERLASATTSCTNHTDDNVQFIEKMSMSPKKCAASKHVPVSILKHKTLDGEGNDRQILSGGSSHTLSPVTFSPSVTEPVSKRHGILKKRSSLDESEILRRRSCSPDVSFVDSTYSEFRPILKNQRRSSLDEIIKRDQSPDQQPASILKRKSSREDEGEIHRSSLGSPEPQSILKRKLANRVRANSISHHVTISSDMGSASIVGNAIVSTGTNLVSESPEGSEVKPILKKYGKEELAGNDVSSHEPRPILKKKSSTESDEHEHDRPKKTILKSSRKNSYEDGGYETVESTSPRKLSALKNRATEIENVRPILKQASSCNRYHGDTRNSRTDSFLRKRAQSVGHARSTNGDDSVESIRMLTKRRSLESSSPIDVSRALATPCCYLMPEQSSEINCTTNGSGVIKESKLSEETDKCKRMQSNTDDMEEKNTADSHMYFTKISTDTDEHDMVNLPARTSDQRETVEKNGQQNMQDFYEDHAVVHRSNSVSKIAQHFKALQEKVNTCTITENRPQRVAEQRSLRDAQRYRKTQSGERFNTQPVTFQEVREAILQNQRNVAGTPENEPSKLSLTERVQLFNERIAIADIGAAINATYRERFTQRRRPLIRHKTQPVTSEEVQVASRISPLNVINHQMQALLGDSKECQRIPHSSSFATTMPQHDLPKSILKSSASYTQNISRAKSPELLRGIKLIKSVLKRESEESEHLTISQLASPEVYPRSILKMNPHLRSIQTVASASDAATSRNEVNVRDIESQNLNSETVKLYEKLDECFDEMTDTTKHGSRCFRNIEQPIIYKKDDTIQDEVAVPFNTIHKTTMFQKEILLPNLDNSSKINTVLSSASRGRQCTDDTWYNDSLTEFRLDSGYKDKSDKSNSGKKENEWNRMKEDAEVDWLTEDRKDDNSVSAFTSDNQEIHSVIVNEKHTNIIWCTANSLIQSTSQYSFVDKNKQYLPDQSTTQVMEINELPSISIADRLAALRHSGNTNWRQRITREIKNNICNDSPLDSEDSTATKSGKLADCMEKLESAVTDWKNRVVAPDAISYTVASKMKVIEKSKDSGSSFLAENSAANAPKQKKIPRRFKMKNNKECNNGTVSTPTSPCKTLSSTSTSFSASVSEDSGEDCKTHHVLLPTVSIPKTDDETFTSFFSGVSTEKCKNERLNLDEKDFDVIASQSKLLVNKRNVQMHHRRAASKNPLKVLAARTDLKLEYTEIRTDTAMESDRNVKKVANSSSFTIEALAGLASKEDFSAVTLRNISETSVSTNKLKPYKDIMLILIKGRRHIQTRLVEPVADSINSGDSYILVTKSEVFHYIGKFSNIIEKTRGTEIALSIQQQKDLGCQAVQVITINEDEPTCTKTQVRKFWKYLGVPDSEKLNIIEAGHSDEDELYESAIINTNMVYELKDKQLVPYERFWGTIPKIELLDKFKILIFDFGTEMYIWSGKGVLTDEKKIATQLAMEMWNDGYDYTECTVCPINAARIIGRRSDDLQVNSSAKSAKSRPEWCLLAKLTQHVETILFREKFLDWPNASSVMKDQTDNVREVNSTIIVHLDNNDDMWLPNTVPVNLVLNGCHLGRGTGYYDNELKKEYIINVVSVTVWHVDEFSHTLLHGSSVGQFFSGDSYIVQWTYSVTITGRKLSGLPSKHSAKSCNRSIYFIWHGRNAGSNERGAAALLAVELDNNREPQIHIVQGNESPVFLNLFSGGMMVHSGKKSEKQHKKRWRLYICQGTLESETFLIEIPCNTQQLRSRGSFVLLDTKNAIVYVWHGNNSLPHIRKNAIITASKLKKNRPKEAGLNKNNVQMYEIEEGSEPKEFSNALGGINKKLYWSLKVTNIQNHTPRLYHLSSISKVLRATEILCPHRTDDGCLVTPFPFSQDDLYQASQPALFLLDDKNTIWIWQGWWPDSEMEDQSGTKTVRWQADRKAAMTIAIEHWRKTRSTQTTNLPIYLVWAGLEPLQFINLFPEWNRRDDVAELNMEDGRKPEETLNAEDELTRLTQSTYSPAQLLQRPLPDGVDPTHLELYLSQQHFQELLGMSKEEFQQLPVWKQANLKKEIGLF